MEFTTKGIITSRRSGDKVYFDLMFMGGKTSLFVPEKLIPDVIENREVQVQGIIGFGKDNKPYFRLHVCRDL